MIRSPELQAHWDAIGRMPCAAFKCGVTAVTIHHCHGGSMRLRGVHKSKGAKTSDWLCVPLCLNHHVGTDGIDSGGMSVDQWELRWGYQDLILDRLCKQTGIDLWAKSREPVKRVGRFKSRKTGHRNGESTKSPAKCKIGEIP